MALNDVYQLVDVMSYDGQQMLNVYFYQQRAAILAGDIPQQLADAFVDVVLPDILEIQTTDVSHTEIRVTNLFNPSEVATSLISEAGARAGDDTEAPFVAMGFRLRQDNGALRNGSKRIGGVYSTIDTDGVVVDSGTITRLLAIGVSLVLGLDAGIVANAFLPVIVGRILEGGDYRLPANIGEAVIGTVVDALYNANTTSQTSRKIGVGE